MGGHPLQVEQPSCKTDDLHNGATSEFSDEVQPSTSKVPVLCNQMHVLQATCAQEHFGCPAVQTSVTKAVAV